MTNLSILFISLFITVFSIPFFRRLAYKVKAVDEPCARKVHARTMPRTGGLAMAVGALVPLALWAPPNIFLRSLLFAALIIVCAGFVDDLVGLGHRAKFGAQVLAAAVIVLYGGVKISCCGSLLPDGWLLSEWLAVPLTIIVIVGVTNAINLADGLDGLAGGISVLSFMVLGYLGFQVGDSVVVMVALAAIGAIFGFLRYNTYPATIFMGDAGSQLLGFLAITLALQLTQENMALSPLLPLLLLGFPILDTMTVMLARIYHGRSPFAADKNHFHHKLMRLGLSHWEAVLIIYLLQVVMVLAAYAMRFYSEWLVLGSYLTLAAGVTLFFYLSSSLHWRIKRERVGPFEGLQSKLAELNKLTQLLRIIFRLLQFNLILLLLVVALAVHDIPGWFAALAAGLGGAVLITMVLGLKQYEFVLRKVLYLGLPFLVYFGAHSVCHVSLCSYCQRGWVYAPLYISMIVLSLLLLKFTRRDGYQSTPLDFLVLVGAIMAPAVMPQTLSGVAIGTIAVRAIATYFAFEVVIEESRTPNYGLGAGVVGALMIVVLKWFWLGS